jgi:hypothetical protein
MGLLAGAVLAAGSLAGAAVSDLALFLLPLVLVDVVAVVSAAGAAEPVSLPADFLLLFLFVVPEVSAGVALSELISDFLLLVFFVEPVSDAVLLGEAD